VLTVGAGHAVYHCRCSNSATAGLISFDSGTTWDYLPAGGLGIIDGIKLTGGQKIQIKRMGGTNMMGVCVSAWGV
jgi:hypothetical protein